jgi:acetoin utilization deacetylase AcuC-like enzyme
MLRRLRNRFRRWVLGATVPVWYSPAYRLPLASVEATGIDARRADEALAHLLHARLLSRRALRSPQRVDYVDLRRVHSDSLIESIQHVEQLARIFRVDPSEIVSEQVLGTVRLACGATVSAARCAARHRGATLNLLGGFHHAGPDRAGGFCPVNDVAVAVAVLRSEGFADWIAVLDLDAHPPDGIVECLQDDHRVWIGSLSGTDWGPLDDADETVLPGGCDDATYLEALSALLDRMPAAGVTFVIAGGDVLAGDRHGGLGLTLDGAQQRDLVVRRALANQGSVWLPGGGYGGDAWRVLAGTAATLVHGRLVPIPADSDPMRREFGRIAGRLRAERLEGEVLTELDLLADLGQGAPLAPRLLGYYTADGLEHAFEQYGVLEHLRRLGYADFRFEVDREPRGDSLRVFARAAEAEHLLVEAVVQRQRVDREEVLYIHWLSLRNPRARFSALRPRLPGQEAPGLGLAREAGELFGQAARRLGLAGIAFRPAWYHMAYQARRMGMAFADPQRQARFETMLRDLASVPLLDATLAVAEGRVLLDGEPYAWEADLMVHYPDYPDESPGPSPRQRFEMVRRRDSEVTGRTSDRS